MSFVPICPLPNSSSRPVTYRTSDGGGIVRVGNMYSFNFDSDSPAAKNDADASGRPLPRTIQPFNQTARLKQPYWRITASTQGQSQQSSSSNRQSERPRPVGVSSFDDGGLFFKPNMSPTHSVGVKFKKSKKKKSKKEKSVLKFSSTPKADTKLLLVRQKSEPAPKIRIKRESNVHENLTNSAKKLEGWFACDDCDAVLPHLDMKVHCKRFHMEVECPDCFCSFVGDQRLSEHLCLPNEDTSRLLGVAKDRIRRNPVVSPPNSLDFRFMSGDELISSARSATDDEATGDCPSENGLMDLTEFLRHNDTVHHECQQMISQPTTPTRIIRNSDSCWTPDFELDFEGVPLCGPVEAKEAPFITSSPSKEVATEELPKLPDVPSIPAVAMVSYVVRRIEDVNRTVVVCGGQDRVNSQNQYNTSASRAEDDCFSGNSSLEVVVINDSGVNIGQIEDADSDYFDLPTP